MRRKFSNHIARGFQFSVLIVSAFVVRSFGALYCSYYCRNKIHFEKNGRVEFEEKN